MRVLIMSFSRSNRNEVTLLIALLVVAAGVRLPGLLGRSIWHDEAVTLLQTAGHFSPAWPAEPTPAGTLMQFFEGTPNLGTITEGLRRVDVQHPPVYYWTLSLWRRWFGFSLETARALSLICSLGTILAFYALLRAARIKHPLILTFIYALSSGAVESGVDARAYALTSLLVTSGALCAYLACEVAPRDPKRAAVYALAMSVCCGVAFQTNYFALFPIGIILLWFLVYLWPVWGPGAIVFPLVAACLGGLEFFALLSLSGTPSEQYNGFVGIFAEVINVLGLTLGIIWQPRFITTAQLRAFENLPVLVVTYGGLVALIGITLVQILRQWSETNRKFWILLLGLAAAPPLGIFLLDLLLDKHFHQVRYYLHAGPALAVMVAYGITRYIYLRRLALRVFLFIIVLGLQMTSIYWGFWPDDKWTDRVARLASNIERSSSPSQVVVIVDSPRGGEVGALTYELDKLDPQTMILGVNQSSNSEKVRSGIQIYNDIWVTFRGKSTSSMVKNSFQNSGYMELLSYQERYLGAMLFRKVED